MNLWQWLLRLVGRKSKLYLTHPEEAPDYTITLATASYSAVMQRWLDSYHVPVVYHDFWRYQIVVHVTTDIGVPAQTWDQDGMRHMAVRPEFLNPGILAHENGGHNSYALLTEQEKRAWAIAWEAAKRREPLVRYLVKVKPYALTSPVEGHAEAYRYLSERMPEELKAFYPKLF